jgi:ComF family protein
LEISSFHRSDYTLKHLSDVYAPCSYDNKFVKKIIHRCKYAPFYKELSLPLAHAIIAHFRLVDNPPDINNSIITPVPLSKRRLHWRGFNQAEIIAQEISKIQKIPINNVLAKIAETGVQAELPQKQRQSNIKNAFAIINRETVKNKDILLVDDVITTGATINECARVLLNNGARRIIGIAAARTEKF